MKTIVVLVSVAVLAVIDALQPSGFYYDNGQ
jgi:hypothetical protein